MILVLSILLGGWLVWVCYRVLEEMGAQVKEGERIIVRLGNHEQSVEWFVRRFMHRAGQKGKMQELLINVHAQDDTLKIIEIFCRKPGYAALKTFKDDSTAGAAVAGGFEPDGNLRWREFDLRELSNMELIHFSFDTLINCA